MLFQGGFSFSNFVSDLFAVFLFVVWFWLLITIFGDLFRRGDISGFGKILWVIVLLVLPYLGIFAYLVSQGRGMAERDEAEARQVRDKLRQVVGYSVAEEIERLERLKDAGTISAQEYARLRARVVG
ncbi:MAG TPA: PLDc N-terminal domain-containing protein [Acetobacteraceae bacterium]|nr:PLDc N-terminal domain-containing protein [Acetobacteraceae bacterium]